MNDTVLEQLFLLSKQDKTFASQDDFKTAFQTVSTHPTILSALLGGALSDRISYAFMAGYQSALSSLFPQYQDRTNGEYAALCITEENGNSPKSIQSTITQNDGEWRLTGTKTFVTGGDRATQLFVAASAGTKDNGHLDLRMLQLDNERAGVSVEVLPTMPFVPEISHGIVHFDNVLLQETEILPGDGYLNYMKPFRTIEDLHVSTALLGYISSRAIVTEWPQDIIEQLLSLMLTHEAMAALPPLSPGLHLQLAGSRTIFDAFLTLVEPIWQEKDPSHFAIWKRDKKILNIAGKARAKRTQTAWTQFNQK